VDLELARQQWQDGTRRVASDRKLLMQVDHVVAALRKRVGQIFTMGAIADAAFDAYARGASDYRP